MCVVSRVEVFAPKDKPYLYIHSENNSVLWEIGSRLTRAVTDPLFDVEVSWAYTTGKKSNPVPVETVVKGGCISGLTVIEGYLGKEEESLLMEYILTRKWESNQVRKSGGVVRRKVLHYGYVFDYETNDIDRNGAGEGLPFGEQGTGEKGEGGTEGKKGEASRRARRAGDDRTTHLLRATG